MAYLSNGNTSDVTSDSNTNWKTDDIAVTVNSTGLAKGEAIGSANVIASFITPEDLTVQDSGVLNVTNAEVVSLQIIPLIDTTPIGLDKLGKWIIFYDWSEKLPMKSQVFSIWYRHNLDDNLR